MTAKHSHGSKGKENQETTSRFYSIGKKGGKSLGVSLRQGKGKREATSSFPRERNPIHKCMVVFPVSRLVPRIGVGVFPPNAGNTSSSVILTLTYTEDRTGHRERASSRILVAPLPSAIRFKPYSI